MEPFIIRWDFSVWNDLETNPFQEVTYMYRKFLDLTLKTWHWLDRACNALFPHNWNPMYYLGGITNLYMWVCMISGVILFLYYTPSLTEAYKTVRFFTEEVPYGVVMRGIHRYGADAMMLFLLLHMFRTWFTYRHSKFRMVAWVSGVILFALTLLIGVTGYIMPWDLRARFLNDVTVSAFHTLDTLPVLGALGVGAWLGNFFQGGSVISDFTLTRFLFFHITFATALFFFLWMHYIRINRPIVYPPALLTIGLIGAVLVAAGASPALLSAEGPPAPTGVEPVLQVSNVPMDWFFLFGYHFMSVIPPVVVLGLFVLVFLGLFLVPYFLKEDYRNVVVVHPELCTGCTLCAVDCHANAIIMVPMPGKKRGRNLLAKVIAPRCAECGICVGSCAFGAIELPLLPDKVIENRIFAALAPSTTSSESQVKA